MSGECKTYQGPELEELHLAVAEVVADHPELKALLDEAGRPAKAA